MKMRDLGGQRFGRLTVVEEAPQAGPVRRWRCLCDCGGEKVARTGHLRALTVTSCGCAARDAARASAPLAAAANYKHGLSRSRLDTVFDNMLKRCYRPNARRFAEYGGRGIAVCAEWREDRAAFYRWALANGYADDLWIERIDPDGHYEPGNCRWATPKEQANNTRRSRRLTWNGTSGTVAEWASRLGVRREALQHRVDRGWSAERIFTQPFRGRAAP